MNLKDLKDRLYYYIVEKNSFIKRDYEGYVNNNLEEHRRNRLKSWLLLIKLNFYYRILRKNEPYFKPVKSKNIKLPYLDGPESEVSKRQPILFFARELLKYDVVSFDIFDTLILRPFAKPSDLFMVLGYKHECLDFMKIRIDAEAEARRIAYERKGNYEVTIYDIYKIIEKRTGIKREYGVKVEFETELELCFANPYIERVFKILKEKGKTIIAVSDMYLPNEMIKQILVKCGYKDLYKIYVSCDHNCSKRSGELYNIVKKDFENKTIVHVGDNYISDIKSAESCGLNTKYYKNVHEIGNNFRADGMSELIGSAYAGIVNTHLHNGLKTYDPYYEYGFIYGGLYVLGYCNWIYKKAKNENIDKILFLSRDGDIYQRIFNMLYNDMPNEYVFWSRIANVKYTADKMRNNFLSTVIQIKATNSSHISVGHLLDSFNLSELKPLLKNYNLSDDTILQKDNLKTVENFFTENWNQVLSIYNKEISICKKYFDSVIGNAKKVAIVDVGWTGTGPLGLKYLIEKKWGMDCKVSCYVAASRVWGHVANIVEITDGIIEPYIFSRMYNRNLYDVHTNTNKNTNNIYFEYFTQAIYPSFSGFYINNNDYGLNFDIPEVENYEIIKLIHTGIEDFCKLYLKIFKNTPILFNISGYDAYVPYRFIVCNLKYIKKYFADLCYARGICSDNLTLVKMSSIWEKCGL